MIEQTIRIQNKLGLHARAASKFVETAKEFSADITVTSPFSSANGKSIMKMMMLQATCGSDVTIQIDGEDEAQALSAIVALIDDKFGEAE